jgi:putative spermidine/putrescine transport system substrate-binding protein
MGFDKARRARLKQAVALGLSLTPALSARSQPTAAGRRPGEVVIASLGGSFEDAQRAAVFEPFQKDTGIATKIVAYTGPSQIVAQVKTGNVEWDVVMISKGTMLSLLKQDALAELDYSRIDKRELDGIRAPLSTHPYGLPYILFSRVIAWNTKLVSNPPGSWEQVWDVKRFPGTRSFGGFSGSLTPDLEFALIADGVPIDKLYPLDVDRAFKSFDRIRPSVSKFWTTGAQIPQMLTDGEVSICSAYNNRIGDVIVNGAPIAYNWNQGELQNNYLCVLKNARNYDSAMAFIAYSARATVQAALSGKTLLGPPNLRAFDHIAPDRAKMLPTAPENFSRQFVYDDQWWGENRAVVQKRWDQWALGK